MKNKILLTPLSSALESLKRAASQPKDEFIRDSVIQRFEYTYELCWKLIRRQLVFDEGVESVAHLSRKDLYRFAADKGWLSDPLPWFAYHKARNETSHVYNEEKAEEVYLVAVAFIDDADALLARFRMVYADQ